MSEGAATAGPREAPAPTQMGADGAWEVVIGLEVHAQAVSQAKLFSGASTAFGGAPNTHVSFVDAAMPGMLPVINMACVRQAVRTGLGLSAKINRRSVFDRKNYFYPDLPPNYQISQYTQPIVGEGLIVVDLPDGRVRRVGIERLHLEQDAGKSLHDQHPQKTYIDLNRAGVALMEIVSRPDLRSAEEAALYFTKLRAILRYLGTCDGDMAAGKMRADANVSVRRPGAPLGTRTETKNLNSIRFLRQAITFEVERQIAALEAGERIVQETRLFDSALGETRPMRSKEEAHDYRYFPDPDLLPLEIDEAMINEIRASLPELPDAKKARFMKAYGLSAYDAGVLVGERETAAFFEAVLTHGGAARDPKLVANWVTIELFRRLNEAGRAIAMSPVSPAALAALLDLLDAGAISGGIAKGVFEEMFKTGREAAAIVAEKGLTQISDAGEIEALIAKLVARNPDQAAEVRAGNAKVIGWFVGQAMKATRGKANPKLVNEALRKVLG